MKQKAILILIGFLIAEAILYPLKKKQEAKAKAEEEEILKKVDKMAKETLRHEKEKKETEIQKEVDRIVLEMEEQTDRDIKDLEYKCDEMVQNYNKDMNSCLTIKYRDKDGNIHYVPYGDHEGFCKMMNDRANKLIFS